MSTFLLIVIAVAIMVGWVFLMYQFVFKPTEKFYKLRNELEQEILNVEDKDGQVKKLYELDKMSWHRSTGEEVRRLAGLMEFKYKINLLKGK